jgi:BirA family biotin operon repressor/biotin-[acetyl-CoA-carboxylase] ligase
MQIAEDILRHLSDGKFHSGSMLAKSLRVSRASIWKGIDFLRELGVEVHAVSNRGYRWHEIPELLNKNQIEQNLAPLIKAHLPRFELIPIIGSTNDYLISRIPLDLPKGTVCLAEAQTAGRGRLGRIWQSPFGSSISLSLYWQFSSPLQALSGLSLMVGIAVLEALKTFSALPASMGIKWPNDILYREGKLAGILVETGTQKTKDSSQNEKVTHVVMGIGINVHLPESFEHPERTDLKKALNQVISRNLLVTRLLEQLILSLLRFEQSGFPGFLPMWQSYDLLTGKNVILTSPSGKQTGQARGINERGELLVASGETLKAIRYGEVSVRSEN